MEGAGENRENFNLSLRMNGPARDLLQNNGGGADGEELQLGLGLSTNGRFGVDPENKRLKRSFSNSNGGSSSQPAREVASESHAPLGRTHSLPVEIEEEWRQRKELQSIRRMEAMKKRMEKKKNVKTVKYNKDDSSEGDSNGNGLHVVNPSVNVDSGIVNGYALPSSQGSVGSQKSGSSGFSDLQSQQTEGVGQNVEVKSAPTSIPSAQVEVVKQEPAVKPAETNAKRGRTESLKSALLDMPYVSTRGDVHNRIEGFLYRYKNGEDIKIVCVCHGLFLSPAEFVKHGGGGDMANPLQHIVVNESALFG